MLRYLYHIVLLLPLLAMLEGCKDDFLEEQGMSLYGTVPVAFSIEEPSDIVETRGVENYKQRFNEGDVIHVQGTFVSKEGETATAYGAMTLSGRKWVPVEGSTLYWPLEAVKGSFKAFYIYNSNYILVKDSSTPSVSLSDVQDGEDPLEGTKEDVPYGYAVDMKFYHACTYLTLEKMEPNVTDYFWMMVPGTAGPIKNAYQLTLDRHGELKLEFISEADKARDNLVYISRPSESQTIEGKTYSKASFYLAPGSYSYFDLRTNNNFPFMSFLNSLKEDLLANHPYTLNVENAKGANFDSTTEVDWDRESDGWKIDVKEFLRAVSTGNDYTVQDSYGNDVPILKKTGGTLLLMQNLDFEFYKDYGFDELGFFPDISNSTVFDGNLHYIKNVGHPIFRFNYGTIKNLGIQNVKSIVTAYEGSFENNYIDDFSRIGALCEWNRTDARIYNIRLEDVDMNIGIQAHDPQIQTSNDNFSIGGLCGDNSGSISEIAMKGNCNINVHAAATSGDYAYVDANINVGGILGNHSSYLSNVGPESESSFSVTITNTCRGREDFGTGVFCLGGAVGQSTGNDISQVVINRVDIIASGSDGYQQYTGGLVGRLRGDGYTMSDCTVQGSLTCGTVSKFGETANNPFSYMGGIAGIVRGYAVSNCRAVCNLDSNSSPLSPDATYATGGAFGRIQMNCTILNNSAYGNVLTGPNPSIGTFAGIANSSYQWADLQRSGNTARAIGSYSEIGDYIDDTSTD